MDDRKRDLSPEEQLDAGYAELAVLYDRDGADADRRSARERYVRRTDSRQPVA